MLEKTYNIIIIPKKYNNKYNSIHEIVIFAKHDPYKFKYMQSCDGLNYALNICLNNLRSPTYGVRYICCSEYGARSDLHARLILTNFVSFTLTDSINSKNKSQKIIRISDPIEDSIDKKLWFDGEHGQEIVFESIFTNQLTEKK